MYFLMFLWSFSFQLKERPLRTANIMDKKDLLTEDEMEVVRKLQSEFMTDEEPERSDR